MSQKVADGIHQLRLAHSKVLYLPEADLLVDTGPETEWDELEEFLDDQGGVDRVLLSHAHGDHVGNVERVAEEYNPELLYPANEPLDSVPLSSEDVTRISDGEELASGVEVVEVPGHTAGICGLYLPSQEILLATDILDGSDRRGLPAGYLLPPPALYNWDSEKAETNLEKLLDLEFDTAVVTHGTNVEEDAHLKLEKFLDFPSHYRANLLAEQDE
jgi:glyoxylase-like metal-dependent hydrolase (beta-lactamase superfamily II)